MERTITKSTKHTFSWKKRLLIFLGFPLYVETKVVITADVEMPVDVTFESPNGTDGAAEKVAELVKETEAALEEPAPEPPVAAIQVQAEKVPPYTGNALPDRDWKTEDGPIEPAPVIEEEPDPEPQVIDSRIICAFPGMGKTYYYDNSNGAAIEIEGINFKWIPQNEGVEPDKIPNPEWPTNYMKHISDQIGKVDTILLSVDKGVRDALVEAQLPFTLVYPENSTESKEAMMERYQGRGKNEAELKQIGDNWERFLGELKQQQGCTHAVLPKGVYLSNYLEDADKTEK